MEKCSKRKYCWTNRSIVQISARAIFLKASPENEIDAYQTIDSENLFSKFEAFLNRASGYRSIFDDPAASSSQYSNQSQKRQIILLDEIPNVLHVETQTKFHAALESLVLSPMSDPPVPIVLVISDAGTRGEYGDEQLTSSAGWKRREDTVVDVRTALSRDLISGPYVTQIRLVGTQKVAL
jgi:cell cycle checkpoint protein